MKISRFITAVGLACAGLTLAGAAHAGSISGSHGNLSWKAQSKIVGATSTGTVFAGGDPRYFATAQKYSGVAALIMDFENGSFICTGSLLDDRRSIVTAAHCVNPDEETGALLGTTAYFYNGSNPDAFLDEVGTARTVTKVAIHPDYTGEVIDQNDIAVLRINKAPDFALSYMLADGKDLQGQQYNIAGVGARGPSGDVGALFGTGRRRQGDNVYDFRLGDSIFGGFWDGFFGTAKSDHSWIADFDNGDYFPGNTSCVFAFEFFAAPNPLPYCNFGVDNEVSSAGGDSGGPQFVNGRLASVTSYGLTFGANFGDVDDALNSSFGEFNGFVPLYLHKGFIASAIPEPGSLGLLGLAGLGLLAMRRRAARR